MKKYSQEKLRKLCTASLLKVGVNEDIVFDVSECLIETSLRGVDSHGIRLLPHYVRVVKSGRINPNPKLSFIQSSPTIGVLDADHTFGHYAASEAMKRAVDMAKEMGSGFVVVKNSNHFSASSYYALQAARNDMIGISATHSTSMAVPTRGIKPYLGTNALTFAFPCLDEDPICLDMATTQLSWNKILNSRKLGLKLDGKYAIDRDGKPTDDPEKACGLLPAGLHKGYGLGLVVEILCAMLSGGPYGPQLTRMFDEETLSEKRNLSHFVGAINISGFIDITFFKQRIKELITELRNQPSINPDNPVMVAGDPEKHSMRDRIKNGIPISKETVDELNSMIKELALSEDLFL